MFDSFIEIVQGQCGSAKMKNPRYSFPTEQAAIMQNSLDISEFQAADLKRLCQSQNLQLQVGDSSLISVAAWQ